jgi:hypothetical protein
MQYGMKCDVDITFLRATKFHIAREKGQYFLGIIRPLRISKVPLANTMGGYFRNKSGQARRDALLLAYRRACVCVCVQRDTHVFVSWCRTMK